MSSDEELPTPATEALVHAVERIQETLGRFRGEIGQVIVGQEQVVTDLFTALLAGGHVIIEGVPGLAKTLLIQSMASATSLAFGRIQFTPDLMPSDVTGTLVVQEDPSSGFRDFVFRKGPVFVNVLLADEVNRTPPKTQAALLEGMSEGRVTVGGARHKLPEPFFVLATQNPIEQEGTYNLPEAQLDRFLYKVLIDYPNEPEEAEVLRRTTGTTSSSIDSVLSLDDIVQLQKIARSLPTSPHIREYATRIVRATRPGDEAAPGWVSEYLAWGAGPRAVQSMLVAAKARTLISGRFSVTRRDIRDVAFPVLRHRILPSFQAEGEGQSADDLIARLLLETSAFKPKGRHDEVTRKILRL
ncbi:MAG: MoxR family ATPase [Planctomycetota bacterium]